MRRTGLTALLIGTALLGAAVSGPARAGWFWEGDDDADRGGWDQPRYQRPDDDGYRHVPHRRVWVRRGDGWYADPYVEYEPDGRYRYAPPESARNPAPARPRKVKRPVQIPGEAEATPSSRVTAAVPPAPNAWRPGALNVVPGQGGQAVPTQPGAGQSRPAAPLATASAPAAVPATAVKPATAIVSPKPVEAQQVATAKPVVAAAPVPVPRPNLEGLDFAPAPAAAPAPVTVTPAAASPGTQREEDLR